MLSEIQKMYDNNTLEGSRNVEMMRERCREEGIDPKSVIPFTPIKKIGEVE